MADSTYGFKFRFRISGGPPTIQDITVADTSFVKGDMANLETGTLDLAATADTALVGAIQETASGLTAGTSTIRVIVDDDAVYGVYDASARLVGACLDLSGTTGAQTVGAASNKEFVVYATSTATEETLVRFNVGKHFGNVAL